MEVGYAYASWKRLLPLKSLVEALAKLRFDTQRLEHEDAHAHKTLLCQIIPLVDGIVEHQDDEIVGPIGVNDEGAEALIALQCLPKQHDHFGCPGQ